MELTPAGKPAMASPQSKLFLSQAFSSFRAFVQLPFSWLRV